MLVYLNVLYNMNKMLNDICRKSLFQSEKSFDIIVLPKRFGYILG